MNRLHILQAKRSLTHHFFHPRRKRDEQHKVRSKPMLQVHHHYLVLLGHLPVCSPMSSIVLTIVCDRSWLWIQGHMILMTYNTASLPSTLYWKDRVWSSLQHVMHILNLPCQNLKKALCSINCNLWYYYMCSNWILTIVSMFSVTPDVDKVFLMKYIETL